MKEIASAETAVARAERKMASLINREFPVGTRVVFKLPVRGRVMPAVIAEECDPSDCRRIGLRHRDRPNGKIFRRPWKRLAKVES